LPPSKVNDGFCDCCDGADEQLDATGQTKSVSSSLCPDICDEVLSEERALRARAEKGFAVGYEKRNQELALFQAKVKENLDKAATLESEIGTLQTDHLTRNIEGLKKGYAQRRMTTARQLVLATAEGGDGSQKQLSQLIEPLTTEELVALIVHTCQMAGEMETVDEEDTCVALRLAGVDMGLIWEETEVFDRSPDLMKVQRLDEESLELAVLLYQSATSSKASWSIGGGGHGRRLDDIPSDDDYRGGGDPDYTGDYGGGEDYVGENEEAVDENEGKDYNHRRNHYQPKSLQSKSRISDDVKGKRKEMMDEIKATIFSKATRMPFLTRSQQLNEELSKLLDPVEEDEEKTREGEEPESSKKEVSEGNEAKEEENIKPPVDPMAYSMVRSTLRRKEEWITRGYQWAASAKYLLSALEASATDKAQFRADVSGLAIGSLFHSHLKAEHVWQILQAILPEFSKLLPGSTEEEQGQTCAVPWATVCPPQSVTRKSSLWGGSSMTLPPPFLLSAAEALCTDQIDSALESSASCSAQTGNDLPTSLPEGYYGYEIVKPRNGDDVLSRLFASMDALEVNPAEVDALEKEKDDLNSRRETIEKEVKTLLKDIGGREQKGLGRDGELYSLKDTCHEVTAGKYTYEVCIFGKAAQKDKGSKGAGTSLGRWIKAEYDEETGQRVLKWDQGAKCWNGPMRSATVFLTCGAENKVLSAEEPETCTYVLQMESYIACDDVFRERVGL
jgi:hypothetical protein